MSAVGPEESRALHCYRGERWRRSARSRGACWVRIVPLPTPRTPSRARDGIGRREGDTLGSVEGLVGFNSADALTGNAERNFLNGLGGADTLTGGAEADQLDGGLVSIPRAMLARPMPVQ